jgi:hypothetical protein
LNEKNVVGRSLLTGNIKKEEIKIDNFKINEEDITKLIQQLLSKLKIRFF